MLKILFPNEEPRAKSNSLVRDFIEVKNSFHFACQPINKLEKRIKILKWRRGQTEQYRHACTCLYDNYKCLYGLSC